MAGVGDGGEPGLVVGQARRPALIQDAVLVHGGHVRRARRQQHLDDGGARRAGAAEHDAHHFQPLAHQFEGVQQRRRHHDGGAVLVVVEDGDVQLFLQNALNFKALGAADVLQVHAAETGGDELHRPHHLGGVLGVQADGEGVHTGKGLEQQRLALHHRQARLGADVPQAQHRRAVGDHRHQVALAGVVIDRVRVLGDVPAGLRHAGGVGQRKVVPRFHRHLAHHFQLAFAGGVQRQRFLVVVHVCAPLSFMSAARRAGF